MTHMLTKRRLHSFAAILLMGSLLTACGAPPPASTTSPASTRQPQSAGIPVRSDSHFLLKAENAKATLVLFTDFQCSYCARIHPLIAQAKQEYAGRINLVVRHFPLSMHRNAKPSAQAVEAAAAQGKMTEMMDLVFSGQKMWAQAADPAATFTDYARTLGLDAHQFAADYSSDAIHDRISRDAADAVALGLRGTPTLVLNGQTLAVDSSTYATIKAPLDEALTQ